MKRLGIAILVALCVAAIFYYEAAKAHSHEATHPIANPDPPIDSETDAPVFPSVFLRDVVVSNTDHGLKDTDLFFNSEPAVAVNPADPRKIVISAFSGSWSPLGNGQFQNAPLWYSTNGGRLWTKQFTIAPPPGVSSGFLSESPCDQTYEYDRHGVLYGTFLLDGSGAEGASCSIGTMIERETSEREVVTGATLDPADTHGWQWYVENGKTQPTNRHLPDQPWLAVTFKPTEPEKDFVYVGYQAAPDMQVSVANANVPPKFFRDKASGPARAFGFNAAHRIAADTHSGAVYSLYQTEAPIHCAPASPIRYILNRSVDGGRTWQVNGSRDGMVAAEVCTHQDLLNYLFGEPEPGVILGGVNPLRGGIDALAVDSSSGDVYVVYGVFDASVNRDRIAIVRVTTQADGTMQLGTPHFVSGTEHQTALPSVAVTRKGIVGVMYDTADGIDEHTGRPFFSVHLAISANQGASFQTTLLQKFLFPENAPSGNIGPRPLGDYQQMKSVGNTFYGVFSGDGQPFGRPFRKIDPIFIKSTVK